MKKNYIARFGNLLLVMLGMSVSVSAATFTALVSGSFSNSATWGGIAPALNLTSDIIIIPGGITVTLPSNLTLTGSSSITVNGTLSSAAGGSGLILSSGSNISGNGTLTLDSLVLGMSSGFGYTGTANVKRLTSLGYNQSAAATINVSESIYLDAGQMNVSSGSVVLASHGQVVVSGGTMAASGSGNLGLSSAYTVTYSGNGPVNTSMELSGTGLGDINVNLSSGSSSVSLSSDLDVKGTLMLTSGMLTLNNHDLTFSGSGGFSAAGTGSINSTVGSDITFASSTGFTGGVRFSSTGNKVNNLTVNMAGGAATTAMLGSALTVNGTLDLQSGTLNVGTNTLTIAASGNTSGGSSSSYVITGTGGTLAMNLAAGGSNTYQIGTASRYAPAIIAANTGGASGTVSVGVNNGVFAQGTSGSSISATNSVVNATWFVASTATTNINLNMQLMWSANMEVNSFDRTKAFISHYTSGSWDVTTAASATATTNGMYSISRNNITSLSPFTVTDKQLDLSVGHLAGNTSLKIYPNPATTVLNFESAEKVDRVAIYDAIGHLVKSASVDGNVVAIADIPAGVYNVFTYSQGHVTVQKFVKV